MSIHFLLNITSIGPAKQIDDMVPTVTPNAIIEQKGNNVALPDIKIQTRTIIVVIDVISVRVNVSSIAPLTIFLKFVTVLPDIFFRTRSNITIVSLSEYPIIVSRAPIV